MPAEFAGLEGRRPQDRERPTDRVDSGGSHVGRSIALLLAVTVLVGCAAERAPSPSIPGRDYRPIEGFDWRSPFYSWVYEIHVRGPSYTAVPPDLPEDAGRWNRGSVTMDVPPLELTEDHIARRGAYMDIPEWDRCGYLGSGSEDSVLIEAHDVNAWDAFFETAPAKGYDARPCCRPMDFKRCDVEASLPYAVVGIRSGVFTCEPNPTGGTARWVASEPCPDKTDYVK